MASTTNNEIGKKLDDLAESFATFSENVTVRLNIMEQSQKRLIDAMYGNGEPGIKEKVREHERSLSEIANGGSKPLREAIARVEKLEQTHAVCPIVRLEKSVEEIEKRHGEEDEIIKDVIEDKEQEEDAARKFKWETLALAVGLILNLIISLFHEFVK